MRGRGMSEWEDKRERGRVENKRGNEDKRVSTTHVSSSSSPSMILYIHVNNKSIF